ncbi:MAG: hypothetical protein J6I84_03180 [Bacilli bacterium]|nr:hypothetical protein [Bacilli bacterium]
MELTEDTRLKLWILGCSLDKPSQIVKWFEQRYRLIYELETDAVFDTDKGSFIELQTQLRKGSARLIGFVKCNSNGKPNLVDVIRLFLKYFRCVNGVIKGPKSSYALARGKPWT